MFALHKDKMKTTEKDYCYRFNEVRRLIPWHDGNIERAPAIGNVLYQGHHINLSISYMILRSVVGFYFYEIWNHINHSAYTI